VPEDPQITRLRNDYDNLRRRHRDELAVATVRGRDEVMVALSEIVDDCDRALAWLGSIAAPDHWRLGIEQLRDRAVQRFSGYGYEPFVPLGETFTTARHEAVGVDHSPGPDNKITAVHRRGWMRDGQIVVVAAVVVRTADPQVAAAASAAGERVTQAAEQVVHSTVRRRRAASGPVFYACPYDSPGCQGDCTRCSNGPTP
jgi:hypothetical protein